MKTLRSLGLLALLAVTARGDDWSHLGRDDARTREAAETIANPSLQGSLATGADTLASPVASDGILVLAAVDGTVRAYRESDRAPLWSVATGASVIATPLAAQGRLYVPGLDGVVRVLRLETGAPLGSVAAGGSGHSSPLLSGGHLYIGAAFPNAALISIDPVAKTVEWTAALDQVSHSSPAVGGGRIVLPTENGTLSAFDAAGAPVWSSNIGASAGASAPLLLGGSVFVAAGETLTRADLASGTVNAAVALTDAAPVDTISTEWSCSSLGKMGALLIGTARVDYALDHNADGFVDAWTLHEFAFALDPVAMTIVWQVPLGSAADVDLNSIPPYHILPAPVSLGATAAFASCLDSDLRILTAGGAPSATIALDAPSQASLLLCNARAYALTKAGTLYALEDPAAPQPPSVGGLTPSGAHFGAGPATLSWTPIADPGAAYTVRLAQDGEFLMDFDLESTVGAASIPCPVLAADHLYTWGVRVRDSNGAFAPWTTASFAVGSAPQPPTALTATPKHARVVLNWTRSTSADVVNYQVAYGPTAGALGAPFDAGNVATFAVNGLAIGTSYTFQVAAENALGFLSAPVTVTATPVATVTIGGTTYPTIAGALAAAAPGQTVQLADDVYFIAATLSLPSNVTLSGVNALATQIVATAPITMIDAATGSTVQNLSLSGGAIGVSVPGQSVTITHCVIHDMSDAGVDVSGIANVVSNTIVANSVAGIRATGRAQTRNNIVQGNGTGLMGVVISKYNDVSDGYSGCAAGEGDLNSAVAFVDAAGGDYREQSGQASLDAGSPGDAYSLEPMNNGYRINMGAFGNTPLAATSPASSSNGGGSSCGLLGIEALLALAFLARRRR